MKLVRSVALPSSDPTAGHPLRRGLLALAAALALAPSPAPARGDSDPAARGLAIARSAEAANAGFGAERATLTMELVNSYGEVRRREVAVFVLEGDDGDKSKVEIRSPADVRGIELLTWAHRQRDDDQWLYLPALKRVKRIAGASRTGSFLGSELTYEDFAGTEVEKYTYRYLDEPRLRERETFRLERFPREAGSGYARQVVWLDKQYQSPLRVEYYDRAGALLKVATFEAYGRVAGFWRPTTATVENVQTRKRTVLRWTERELPARLAAADFDPLRLGG